MRGSRQRRRWRGAIAIAAVVVVSVVVGACSNPINSDDGGGGSGSGTDEPETYTVSHEANGADSGTAPEDQTKTQGVELTLANNSGNLARTGHSFAGWNTTDNGSGTDYAEGATYSTDADVTLYAKWTQLPTFTVAYEANGADSGTAPEDQTETQGVELTLANNSGNLARTGHSFAGWNTTDNGSGTDYAEGATYSTDAGVTLYAKWTANTYTVSFNLQGGTGWSTSVTVTFGQPMPAAIAPTKADAGFWGYYVGGLGTGPQYYTAAMESTRDWDIPADIELIAYWMQVGGTGPAGGVVFYDKGGYTEGWRFLEAWPADEAGTHYWKTDVTTTAGTSTAVGSGYENTYSWMTGTKHPAAEVVRNAAHGGYNDWFLPSKDELHQMYLQRAIIGSFASRYYWSSSESSANLVWEQDFHDGNLYGYGKMHGNSVRAARAF